jgi:tRNA (guanine-N7-)-methyltransferase
MDLAPLRPTETTWEDWVLGGGAKAAFGDPTLPLEVEIGPGEDAFLLDSAHARPDRNWLGVEYSRKRVRRYVRRVRRAGGDLANLRLIWRPAADLVGPFLTPACVHAYHVYFPDPWPKAHHARYRLLTPEFVASLRASLVPGGRVDLATDSAEYVQEIRAAFDSVGGFSEEPVGAGAVAGERPTVFEERWRALGRRIHFLRFGTAG